jgi:hypothetical protein
MADFTDSIHPAVADYRRRLADQGLFDDKDDLQVVRFLAQQNPSLLEQDPTFGELYGQIREVNAPGLGEEFGRAFKRAGIGLGSTAVGGAALLTGSDTLRRKAAALQMQASDPDLAPTIPTLEDIRPGQDGAGQAFSRDALRYGISKVGEVVPSLGEAVALSGIGALAGSAIEPGAGTLVGAGAGAVEGLIGRGVIRKAIRSLVNKDLTEEAIVAGLRRGAPEVIEAVTKNAKGIAGAQAGTVTAGLNSFLLNAGDVYSENDDRGVAAALGLISAIPDTVLPALVVRKLFPGVSLSQGREAAKELVGSNALKVAKAAGVTGFEGATESFQEAVNVVARNLKDNVDPFTMTDEDMVRIREAGITGLAGGALAAPAVVMERTPAAVEVPQAVPPVAPVAPTVAPVVAPAPVVPVATLPTQRVRAMTPEQQAARLSELESRARVGDEEAEYQILRATVRAAVPAAQTPAAALAPITLESIATNELPSELGALTPPATPTAPADSAEEQARQQEVARRAMQAAQAYALPRQMAGAPVAPELEVAAPVAPITPAIEPEKEAALRAAISDPGVQWQYTVQRPMVPGGKGFIQVDAIKDGVNTVSSNLEDLAALGAQMPAVPDWVPQGQYSLPQIQEFARQGEPVSPVLTPETVAPSILTQQGEKSALREQVPAGGVLRPETPQPQVQVELQGVVPGNGPVETARQVTLPAPEGGAADGGGVGPAAPIITTASPITPRAAQVGLEEIVQNRELPEAFAQDILRSGGNTRESLRTYIQNKPEGRALVENMDELELSAWLDKTASTLDRMKSRIAPVTVAPAAAPALPLSREQRLNDAGIDLPPISSLKAPQKLAELKAGGVTTYNGKPIEEANGAQLSNALGKFRRGELGTDAAPAPRTSTVPANPAVIAQRTKEFQAVMARLVQNGANVQAMSQELLAQQTGEMLQQQIQALEQRLAQATTASQRRSINEQLAIRQQRLSEVAQMRGVTYDPYHIAIAMDDVMNASLDNLVTLIHEAAESLTMRLTPAQQGAVFRAVETATAQMQQKMQDAAKNTGATVADVPNPGELLAETLAQTLAAEGIQDAPSLSQAIVRWIKEIYYRVAMAAQRAFGAEPNPTLALDWYENQLRRELGGDYEYAFSRLLDRFLPQSNANFASQFTGNTGTPGGMPDFFDPTTGKTVQPWVQPTSDTALDWNMKFQTQGVNPGDSEGIPADEAVARQTAAAYNEEIKWLTDLHAKIAPEMDMADFLGLVSPGQKTPHEMLDVLKTRMPGVETAEIGGERMTDPMNKWASWQVLKYMQDTQARVLSSIAKMETATKEADERFTEHAAELNRLEPDVRNAELHEGELKKKVRTLIDGLLKSYKNGLRTSSQLGRMVEAEENLSDRDPLPQFYAQAFVNLMNAEVPLFDYVDAIASLDLPLEEMTPEAVWKAIRDNADTSPKLKELTRNKPLGLTLAVLARNNSREIDQIQLRRSPPEEFLNIRRELNGIRNATEAQLREMLRTIDEKNDAKGLRQRIKTAYLKERRALKRASDRIAQIEERTAVLEKAKAPVAEKLAESQQAIGGVFSEWTPGDGQEFTVMRRGDDGSFSKATRTLRFNPDGSAQDSTDLLNDIAMNEQWLKANQDRAGTKEYEQVKHQTRALELMDVQRAYQAANFGKVMGMIDKFVRPLQAIARQAGHSSGNRIVQQFNKYEFINRSGAKALTNQSYEWGAAEVQAMKALGMTDVGQFRSRIYNPVKFMLGVNPGWDQATALREAVREARKRSPSTPAQNFDDRFKAFLLKDKEIEDELLRTAESNNVLVWDEKLGELRKAIARGWSTGMRSLDDGVVVTLIHDMERAGWKLAFDKDALAKQKKVVTRASTFDDLNPKNAASPEERAEYYATLDNTDAVRAAITPFFTPGVVKDWLLPFINKPGESVFKYDGNDIPQIALQNAWARSGGDVLTWIDSLGQDLGAEATDDASAAASFRWDMLNQIDQLFGWEAKMAYEAEQTPDLFDASGSKMHVMMDARVNDLLPEEHVRFSGHDPTSTRQMLGQIAFHGAFGRNGAGLMANLKELEAVSAAKKFAFDGLRSTTVEGRRREAKERGMNYDELKRAVDHYHDVLELKGEIESAMGVSNIYGPLHDARAGMELLNFMVGQVVDQPKTGALNFLSIGARPFAMHSFSPKVLKATGLAYADLAKNSFGGLLRDLGIDLIRESEYAKETGEIEGKAFRRLPFGTVLSGDTGKEGSFQDSLSSRYVVQPLRILKALQRKGVGPGLAAIPGLGTMARFATEGAMANIRGQTFLLQEIINNGIRHFSAHPEDLANPAFRFDASTLKLKGDRGMYDWFRNKTVEYNMGSIERIVRDAIERQAAGERTITTEMVEQLSQMNAQELDGASSINTAPAGLAQNQALRVALPLLRWPLWMMHAAHEGLADANGRADFKSMLRGIGRLAAWNLPLGLAFTFLIDEYDEKILGKKNAMPSVSPLAAIPVAGVPLALATSPRTVPQELLGIGQRMIRSGNIYGLGGDLAGQFIAPFDPGSGQRAFSLDQRVLIMSQFLNLQQAISNMVSQGGTATWGSVYRPLVASIGGNGMLNSLDVVNRLAGLDNAEARLTQRINAARWVNTAAKELEIETKKSSGFSSPTPMSVWTREMQLAAMANDRMEFMEAYRKALDEARETVTEDDRVPMRDKEKEAVARVLASWRSRNPFSGLMTTPTPAQIQSMLGVMNEQGRSDVTEAMRLYESYTRLIKPSETEQYLNRRMRAAQPQTAEQLRRRAMAGLMVE